MKVTLPSGKRVDVEGTPLDDLALADANALRAIRTKKGELPEEAITITCRNCGVELECRPCAGLALGPFVDGELDDPELDSTLPLDTPHRIPRVRLVGGGVAETVTFTARTYAQAAPLREALARRRFVVTPAVVKAMGITALGAETRPDRIARALETAPDAAWGTVTDLFLEVHYPPRLFAVVPCPECGARNDVDAPYDREFERELEPGSTLPLPENRGESNAEAFPDFDGFDRVARSMADEELGRRNAGGVAFVVDGGVAACDDGGEPLLGSYVHGSPAELGHPARDAEITVYFRTFAAIWAEEGPYDWRGELAETIEHELDHHFAYLTGDDPMDDEERDEIAREAIRIHGKKALARGAVGDLGHDVAAFIRRTWPIWLLLALATIAATLSDVR